MFYLDEVFEEIRGPPTLTIQMLQGTLFPNLNLILQNNSCFLEGIGMLLHIHLEASRQFGG
jgi:hypothetical protein